MEIQKHIEEGISASVEELNELNWQPGKQLELPKTPR